MLRAGRGTRGLAGSRTEHRAGDWRDPGEALGDGFGYVRGSWILYDRRASLESKARLIHEITEAAPPIATALIHDQDGVVGVEHPLLFIIGHPERFELSVALDRANDVSLCNESLSRQV